MIWKEFRDRRFPDIQLFYRGREVCSACSRKTFLPLNDICFLRRGLDYTFLFIEVDEGVASFSDHVSYLLLRLLHMDRITMTLF